MTSAIPWGERNGLERDQRILMYSTQWCGDCRRAKRVFAELGMPYTEIDIEQAREAAELVMSLSGGYRSVPTILFPDGTVLVEPSNAALTAKVTELANR